MATIAELLQQYSKEAAAIESDETPNTEEVVEVLEEVIEEEVAIDEEEGAVLSEEGAQIVYAIDTLCDAQYSLESSVEFLEALASRGPITDTSMQIFNSTIVASLEARGVAPEIFGDDVVFSAEDAKSGDSKVKAFFVKIWEMIKRGFQRMREWVIRFVGWFRNSGKAVRAAAEKLQKGVAEKKSAGAKAEGREFNAAPFVDLNMGNKLDATRAMTTLNGAATKVLSGAVATVETSAAAIAKIGSTPYVNETHAGIKRDYAHALSKVINDPLLTNLPGGRKFVIDVNESKKGYKVKVKVFKDTVQGRPADSFQPVLPLATIETLAKDLITLVDGVEKGISLYEKAVEKANLKDMKDFKLEVGEGRTEGVRSWSEISSMIVQSNAVAQRLVSEISKIVFPIAKRIYVLGAINLRQYN